MAARHAYTRRWTELFAAKGPPSRIKYLDLQKALNCDFDADMAFLDLAETREAGCSFFQFWFQESKVCFKAEGHLLDQCVILYTIYQVAKHFNKTSFYRPRDKEDDMRLWHLACSLVRLFETLVASLRATPNYTLVGRELRLEVEALSNEYIVLYASKRRLPKTILCKNLLDALAQLYDAETILARHTTQEDKDDLEKVRHNIVLLQEALRKMDREGDMLKLHKQAIAKKSDIFVSEDIAFIEPCHTATNRQLVYLQLIYPNNLKAIPDDMYELDIPTQGDQVAILRKIWEQQRPLEEQMRQRTLPTLADINDPLILYNCIARATENVVEKGDTLRPYAIESLIVFINKKRKSYTLQHAEKIKDILPSRVLRLVFLLDHYSSTTKKEDKAWLKRIKTEDDLMMRMVRLVFAEIRTPAILHIEQFWIDLLILRVQRTVESVSMLCFIYFAFRSRPNEYDFKLLFHADNRKRQFCQRVMVDTLADRRAFFLDEMHRIAADIKFSKEYFENSFELIGRNHKVFTVDIEKKIKHILLCSLVPSYAAANATASTTADATANATANTTADAAANATANTTATTTATNHSSLLSTAIDEAIRLYASDQIKTICHSIRVLVKTHMEIYQPLYSGSK